MAVQFQKIDLLRTQDYELVRTYGASAPVTDWQNEYFAIDQTSVGQDTNTWYQFYIWVSNPGEHSLWICLELGQRYGSWANTWCNMIVPPKSGWNLHVPGLILRGVKYNDGVTYPYYYQELFMNTRDVGTGYMCGYVQKTPALPYTTVGEGLFALSNSAYDPGYADEPCGAAIQMLSPQESGSYKRLIHTAVSGTSYCDEVWLWANCSQFWGGGNQSAYCHRQLYIEWGDTDTAKVSMFLVPPDAGWVPVIQGAILQNGAQIRGWAENYADAEINVSGYVWRKAVGT